MMIFGFLQLIIQKSKIKNSMQEQWWTTPESTSCHLQSQSAYLHVVGTRFQFESLGI